MLQVSVYRYNPDHDEKPYMQDFQVNTDGKDLMVLDVLALVKEQDQGFLTGLHEPVSRSPQPCDNLSPRHFSAPYPSV